MSRTLERTFARVDLAAARAASPATPAVHVIRREPTARWLVAAAAIRPDAPVDWALVAGGDHVAVPLFRHAVRPDEALAVAAAVGATAALSAAARGGFHPAVALRLHVAFALDTEPPGGDGRWHAYLGLAIQVDAPGATP